MSNGVDSNRTHTQRRGTDVCPDRAVRRRDTSQMDAVIDGARQMIDSNFDSPPEGLEGAKAVWMLVDRENARGLGVTLLNEEDLRRGDEALNAMSPAVDAGPAPCERRDLPRLCTGREREVTSPQRRGGATGGWQDRRGRRRRSARTSKDATTRTAWGTPEQPGPRLADDRRRRLEQANGLRARLADHKSRGGRRGRRQRLRARPLQPQRDARPELLRGRQPDDQLRGLRRGARGGATGERRDRRRRGRAR